MNIMGEKLVQAINTAFCAIGIKSMEAQYFISYVLIIVCGLVLMGAQYMIMGIDATKIDIAGRKRMLSQRLAKAALLTAQKVESREVMKKTIDLFESSHLKLLNGDSETGMTSVTIASIRQQLKHVDKLWMEYITEIYTYVDNPQSGS